LQVKGKDDNGAYGDQIDCRDIGKDPYRYREILKEIS
jgi:hypothetical protein